MIKRLLLAIPLVLHLSGAAGLAGLVCATPDEPLRCCCCARPSGPTRAPDVRPSCPCNMVPRDPAAPGSVPSATLESHTPRAWTPAIVPVVLAGHLLPALEFEDLAPVASDSGPPHLRAAHLRC